MDRRRIVVTALVVVLAGLVAFEVFLLTRDRGLPDVPEPTVEVAREFALAATSFDHTRIEDDIARVLSFGDDDFVAEFRAAMGPDFATDIVSARRTSTGEIIAGPTVQRLLADRAVLLVVLNQRVTSQAAPSAAPTPDPSPTPAATAPQIVRIGMLVTVETDDDPQVTSVEVL